MPTFDNLINLHDNSLNNYGDEDLMQNFISLEDVGQYSKDTPSVQVSTRKMYLFIRRGVSCSFTNLNSHYHFRRKKIWVTSKDGQKSRFDCFIDNFLSQIMNKTTNMKILLVFNDFS